MYWCNFSTNAMYFPQILKHKVSLLEASNAELQRELQNRRITCDHLTQHAVNAQVTIFVGVFQ